MPLGNMCGIEKQEKYANDKKLGEVYSLSSVYNGKSVFARNIDYFIEDMKSKYSRYE